MKVAFLLIFVIISLFGCHQSTNNNAADLQKSTETPVPDTTQSIKPTSKDEWQNTTDPRTLSAHTKIYASADSNSAVLKILDFGTLLKLGKEEIHNYNITKHAKDKSGNDYTYQEEGNFIWYNISISGLHGFIKYTDVAKHTFIKSIRNTLYLYLITSELSVEHNPHSRLKILKYDQAKKIIIDSLEANYQVNLVKIIDNVSWENLDLLFSLTFNDGDCHCMGTELFVADANHKLDTLISSSYEADDDPNGYSQGSNIYLPVIVSKDKIKFILNGDPKYLPNPQASKFEVYDKALPSNTDFNRKELVIKTFGLGPNGIEKPKHKSAYNLPKERNKMSFFKWDGFKLKQVGNTVK